MSQLVYAEAGHSVDTVFVDGRMVVERGRPLTADLGRACERLQEIGARLRHERARVVRVARRLEPLWRTMIEDGQAAPLPINRLAWSPRPGRDSARPGTNAGRPRASARGQQEVAS